MERLKRILIITLTASAVNIGLYILLPNLYPLYLLPPLLAGALIGYLSSEEVEWIISAGLTSLSPQIYLTAMYAAVGLNPASIYDAGLPILVPFIISLLTLLMSSNLIYVLKRIGWVKPLKAFSR